MKSLTIGLMLACLAAGSTRPASASGPQGQQGQQGQQAQTSASMPTKEDARNAIKDWPQVSQNAANSMLDKYGNPDVVSGILLVWKDKVPFNKIVVLRDGVRHTFPREHMDVLSEEINLQVPIDKVIDLARFDGSLMIDRTKGTVTSRCDTESNNLLALNLANDIIAGKKDVDSARKFLADTSAKGISGKSSSYMDKLQFTPKTDTGDADSAVGGSSSPSGSQGSSGSQWQSPSMTPSEPSSPGQTPSNNSTSPSQQKGD